MSGAVDPSSLPLEGTVLDLDTGADGWTRVTFRELAGVYYVSPDAPDRAGVVEALEASRARGVAVQLRYSFPHKVLALPR